MNQRLVFDGLLDTQGFVVVGELVFIVHHQYQKVRNRSPVEIFELESGRLLHGFGASEGLRFPTSIAYHSGRLAVTCNGQGFEPTFSLFDVSQPFRPDLVLHVSLGQEIDRPTGLFLEKGCALMASYSRQILWSFDLETLKISQLIDVSRYGQTTPMGISANADRILVLGHLDGSLVSYCRRYLLPQYIQRKNLSLPWSIVENGDGITVSNCGSLDAVVAPGFLSTFSEAGKEVSIEPLEGAGALQLTP